MSEENLNKVTFLENKIADIEHIQNEIREFMNAEKDSYFDGVIVDSESKPTDKLSDAINKLIEANAELSIYISGLYIENAFR